MLVWHSGFHPELREFNSRPGYDLFRPVMNQEQENKWYTKSSSSNKVSTLGCGVSDG